MDDNDKKCRRTKVLSQSEFIEKVKQISPNIEVIGNYVNNRTKVLCKCAICNHEWMGSPKSFNKGRGCPECSKRQSGKRRRLSQDEFLARVRTIHPKIKINGEYINIDTRIECFCTIHNHTWDTSPHSLLAGHGCPICGKLKQTQSQTTSHDEFVSKMKTIHPNIEVIGTYINSGHKVKCRCIKHDYIWDGIPGNLLYGSGCYYCGKESMGRLQTLTQEEYEAKFKRANPNFTIISNYKGRKEKIKCKCNICNYEWESTASYLLSERKCPLCSNMVVVKGINDIATTHAHLIKYVKNIEDCYTHCATNKAKITFKCPVCGDEREMRINNVVKTGYHCFYCDKNISIPNKVIRNLIRQLPVDTYAFEFSPDWVGLCKYDAYFEYKGTPYIVEMDGSFHFQWHEEIGITKQEFEDACKRDEMKNRLADEHGIIMIRIRCESSEINYISSQIQKSLLGELFDLSNINWDQLLFHDTLLVQTICDTYNSLKPISITKLSEKLEIERHAVSRYLKWGATLGLCKL